MRNSGQLCGEHLGAEREWAEEALTAATDDALTAEEFTLQDGFKARQRVDLLLVLGVCLAIGGTVIAGFAAAKSASLGGWIFGLMVLTTGYTMVLVGVIAKGVALGVRSARN